MTDQLPRDLPADGAARPADPLLVGFDDLHEAVVAADRAGTIVYANAAVGSLLGWDPAELRGRPLQSLIPERFRRRHTEGFARYRETGEATVMGRPLQVPALRPDGTEVSVELVVTATDAPSGHLLLGLLRDVGDRLSLEGPGELPDRLLAVLAEAVTVGEALDRVVAVIGESLGWAAVSLWLVGDGGLRRRAWWARDPRRCAPFIRAGERVFPRGVGLPGRVWAQRAPAWITDVATEADFPRAGAAIESGLVAGFAFPMSAGTRFLGVIELFADEPRSPSPELVDHLARLGSELGTFIHRRTGEEERLGLLRAEQEARARADAARARLAFVSEASALLAESLDLEITLERVCELAVPTLGDWCAVHLLEGDQVRLAAAAHVDEAMVERLHLAHTRYPVSLEAPSGVGFVVRTGELLRHPVLTDDVLASIARDEEHLELLRSLGFGSVTTVPLAARGRRFGALTVAAHPGRVLDDLTVETTVDLARRASLAIDTARLHRDLVEAHEARRFQAALLQIQSEAGREGQMVVSPSAEIISWNHRFAEMWGLSEDLVARGSDEEALAVATSRVADPDGFLARVRDIYADPRTARDEVRLRDGRVFDRFGAPLWADDVYLGYAWYFRDITEEKRAERRLRQASERTASLARTLQRSLLPPELPAIAGLELAARYHPAGEGNDVGGDFYDVFSVDPSTWGVVIGDVCGKGAGAAATTALVRYTLRAAAIHQSSPAAVLRHVNEAMLRDAASGGEGRFATMVFALLRPTDGRTDVQLAVAGHPSPLVRRADGTVEEAGRSGTLLGVLDEPAVHDVAAVLAPGDCLVLVTDGVTEARRGDDQLGDDGLRRIVAEGGGAAAEELAAAIAERARRHHRGRAGDDIAVLVLRADTTAG